MDRFLEMTCSLVLVGSALAFGGVDPLTYSLAEIVLLAVLLSLLIKQLRDGKVHLLLVPVGPVLFLMWAAGCIQLIKLFLSLRIAGFAQFDNLPVYFVI